MYKKVFDVESVGRYGLLVNCFIIINFLIYFQHKIRDF